MNAEQKRLLQEPVFRHFHALCQIPHPSFHEEQISRYLFQWACERGLESYQDEHKNVLIRKPASAGYENAPCVMLQAHTDMVCEKAPGVEHDFEKDPIQWQIEGDRINTNGRTTLGADDGVGVALALSILEDDTLPHPALEVLFTTAEEEDFSGAAGFDADTMRSKYLINLDHCCDQDILCGSCGGQAAELSVPVAGGPVPAGWVAHTLTISGLLGGHSAEDIDQGHGSATSMLVRMLLAFEEQSIPFKLGPVNGGSFRLAIPRDASAVVCFPAELQDKLCSVIDQLRDEFSLELLTSGAQMTASFASTELPAWCSEPDVLLTVALLSPDGIYQMNEALTGLVDTSDNMGELYLTQEGVRAVYEIRSARPSLGNYLYQRICRLARMLGGTCSTDRGYPSWYFRPQSQLRSVASEAYCELFGQEPRYLTVHGGLEVGFFSEKKPGLDAISIGPNCWNCHSPSEEMSISSVRKVYQLLCGILARCQ